MPDVRLSDEPARLIAALAHKGAYDQINSVFEKAGKGIAQQGRQGDVAERLAVYHDNPASVPEENLRSHAGFTLKPGRHVPEGFEALHLDAGRYAICRHKGPYEGLAQTWEWFLDIWMKENNESPEAASMFEVYPNSPETTPPEQLETLIYVQLEDDDFNGPV